MAKKDNWRKDSQVGRATDQENNGLGNHSLEEELGFYQRSYLSLEEGTYQHFPNGIAKLL